MMNLILKTWIWITFLRSKNSLPTKSKIINPKLEYEGLSGAFIWEDEGLWEVKNHHLINAFKYVIHHRMRLVVGADYDAGIIGADSFDKEIFEMAKKYFPTWVGFDESRCSYNPELANRIMRVRKVADWKAEKLLSEEH